MYGEPNVKLFHFYENFDFLFCFVFVFDFCFWYNKINIVIRELQITHGTNNPKYPQIFYTWRSSTLSILGCVQSNFRSENHKHESQVKTPLQKARSLRLAFKRFFINADSSSFRAQPLQITLAVWPRKYRSTSARAFWNCLRPTVDCCFEHRSQ